MRSRLFSSRYAAGPSSGTPAPAVGPRGLARGLGVVDPLGHGPRLRAQGGQRPALGVLNGTRILDQADPLWSELIGASLVGSVVEPPPAQGAAGVRRGAPLGVLAMAGGPLGKHGVSHPMAQLRPDISVAVGDVVVLGRLEGLDDVLAVDGNAQDGAGVYVELDEAPCNVVQEGLRGARDAVEAGDTSGGRDASAGDLDRDGPTRRPALGARAAVGGDEDLRSRFQLIPPATCIVAANSANAPLPKVWLALYGGRGMVRTRYLLSVVGGRRRPAAEARPIPHLDLRHAWDGLHVTGNPQIRGPPGGAGALARGSQSMLYFSSLPMERSCLALTCRKSPHATRRMDLKEPIPRPHDPRS